MVAKLQDSTERDVSKLTDVFKAAHFGRRVCQLFSFLPLFLIVLTLFEFALDLITFGMGALVALLPGEPPAEPLSLEAFVDILDFSDLIGLLIAASIFVALSNLRYAIWFLPFGLGALAANLYNEVVSAFDNDFDWASQGNPDMVIAQSIVPYLYLPLIAALHALFAWILMRSCVLPLSVSPETRSTISDQGSFHGTLFNSFKNLVNIPEANRYAKRRSITGILMILAGLANFMNFWRAIIIAIFFTLVPVLAVDLFPRIGVVIRALIDGRNLARVTLDLTVVTPILLFFLVVMLAVPWLIGAFSRRFVRISEEQMRISLERVQHLDERAPILFLRSFVNDTVPLPNGTWTVTRWLVDSAGAMDTLDMMILSEGTRYGPTVALGNPDDPAPPYGVARGYFDHSDWKDAVSRLCEKSAAIVMVLDETEGVEWEISHIATRKYTDKTLFLLAPGDVGTTRGNTLLGGALERATNSAEHERIARIADQSKAPVFGFKLVDGCAELLTSKGLEKYDYLVTLRIFLRGLTTGLLRSERETSIPPPKPAIASKRASP